MDRHTNDGRWLRCHACGELQRDRRSYRDHLLRIHQEVTRRGADVPVRLEGRELEAVWAGIQRRHEAGMATASRRRENLGLPRVSDREAARRLLDNRARSFNVSCTLKESKACSSVRESSPILESIAIYPEIRLPGRTPQGSSALRCT